MRFLFSCCFRVSLYFPDQRLRPQSPLDQGLRPQCPLVHTMVAPPSLTLLHLTTVGGQQLKLTKCLVS